MAEAMTTAFTSVGTQITTLLPVAVTGALAVFAALFVPKKVLGFFKGMAK